MTNSKEFGIILKERLPFLQSIEEGLFNRMPYICTDLSKVRGEITTPLNLQHVGEQIIEIAKSDWMTVKGLDTVFACLNDLIDLWETIFNRHQQAVKVFTEAKHRPYCLYLRSFTSVTNPIEVIGARAVIYLNQPELDANFASTLMKEAVWLNPVSCMHTDDMQLLIRSGQAIPAFRVQTVNWQNILNDAIASSGIIIFYLDGESQGVNFEIDCIKKYGMKSRTLLVYRGEKPPNLCDIGDYPVVMPVDQFIEKINGETGSGVLSKKANDILRRMASAANTKTLPTHRLLGMPCEIIDSEMPAGFGQTDPLTSYYITEKNSDALVNYVQHLPDSFLQWNAISQNIRLRGMQPGLNEYNMLYRSLRMAFVASTCLGFTCSIACTVGLLAKVTSMAKQNPDENHERIERYMNILNIAQRFNALTQKKAWSEKIEAFRESILEDPFW